MNKGMYFHPWTFTNYKQLETEVQPNGFRNRQATWGNFFGRFRPLGSVKHGLHSSKGFRPELQLGGFLLGFPFSADQCVPVIAIEPTGH